MQITAYQVPINELTDDALRDYIAQLKADIKCYRESALALFDVATGLYVPKTPGLKRRHSARTKSDDDRCLATLRNIMGQTRLRLAELALSRRITGYTRNAWLINEMPYEDNEESLALSHTSKLKLKPTAIHLL